MTVDSISDCSYQFDSTNAFFMCNSWLFHAYVFQRFELPYNMKNWKCKDIFTKKILKEKKRERAMFIECHSTSKRTD